MGLRISYFCSGSSRQQVTAERRDDYGSHSGHVGINAAITEDVLQNVSPDVNGDPPKIKITQQDKITLQWVKGS